MRHARDPRSFKDGLPPAWEPPKTDQLLSDFLIGAARFLGWAVFGVVLGTLLKVVVG